MTPSERRDRDVEPAQPRVWQRMLSGRKLDLLNPSPADIDIADIAHGLARVARWNGQTEGPNIFSVAQHSVMVEAIMARLAPLSTPAERLAALLHDSPEYVIGDLISPFKAVLGDAYRSIEHRLLDAIHARFGLPISPPALVNLIKQADRIAAYREAIDLAGFDRADADRIFGIQVQETRRDEEVLSPARSEDAERVFLDRFAMLSGASSRKEPV
ncbi:hydrolase [Lichenihabitans psoromatis]|uniref:hydrolase n=1 Tax=Lichenihabitans psoromatis TaxID=2528642 RepID=UPI003CCAE9A7